MSQGTAQNCFIEIGPDNFDKEITNQEGWVLLAFYSPSCGPCKMLELQLESFADKHPAIKLTRVNTLTEPAIAWAFEVLSTPALAFFHEGILREINYGFVPQAKIEEILGELGCEE